MIFLQAPVADSLLTKNAQMENQTVIELIYNSGGTGVAIVLILLVLSVISITIFIERFLSVGKAMSYEAGFVNGLRSSLQGGNVPEAQRLCQTVNTPISRMLDKGITRLGEKPETIVAAMEAMGRLEVTRLEKNLGYLSLIAKLAPMFGFVGTIMGVIKIFYDIAMTDNLSIGVISGGLYQKMITSAAGLMVGIIAFLGYYLVNMRIEKVVERMEQATLDFMDILFQRSA
jgi:biopolymer transport protein ExbB